MNLNSEWCIECILAKLSIELIKCTPESGERYVSHLTFTDQIFAKSRSEFRESGWSGGEVFVYGV